jgi:hypothetical protein
LAFDFDLPRIPAETRQIVSHVASPLFVMRREPLSERTLADLLGAAGARAPRKPTVSREASAAP